MGGRSASTITEDNGTIRFAGNLSKVGGGFCSARTADAELSVPADAAGLLVEYASDHFCYKVTVKTKLDGSGTNWMAALPRGTSGVTTEFLPFSAFKASSRGIPIPDAVLDIEQVHSLGLMCSVFEDGVVIEDAPDGEFAFTLHSVSLKSSRGENKILKE